MNAWTRFLAATLALGAVGTASDLVTRSLWAADSGTAAADESAAPETGLPQPTLAANGAPVPAAGTPVVTAATLPPPDAGPGRFDKRTALIGGLLMLAAAAIGLTITFRALLHDMRGRRRRYRRRVRREPDSARA